MRTPPDATDFPPDLRINPGYVLGQLAHALTTSETNDDPEVRARAAEKVARWRQVFEGVLSGALEVGSRKPVAGTPEWATLKVVTGGFATGELLAEGPLAPHERRWLEGLGPDATRRPRAALNAYFLSDAGQALLGDMLATGAYRIDVPEEGALLVVTWLLRHGEAEAARALLAELGPFFSRLRFYPVPHPASTEDGLRVHLQSVEETATQLQRIRQRPEIDQQRESAEVWTPLYDRLVALFVETRTPAGACQQFPEGWSARARSLLDEVAAARSKHPRCRWPHRSSSNFAKLSAVLASCVREPASVEPGQKRQVQHILDDIARARGLPGSDTLRTLREEQARIATLPTHKDLARVLAERLRAKRTDQGLDSPEQVAGPVTGAEASRHGIPEGRVFPPSLTRKLLRCVDGSLEELIARKVVTSSEVLARVLPQVSSHVAALGVTDAELRRLYGHLYAAFRRRRSLLLLDLQSQVKLHELPWARAIDAHRAPNLGQREVARQTFECVAALAVSKFPDALLPNKLVQELGTLCRAAGLELPLVEELAADIFMGTFSAKFLSAAQRTAAFVEGGLYARYYEIPISRLLRADDLSQGRFGARTSQAFDALCLERARTEGHAPGGVAGNGMIIEQAQILTTHNLAVLFETLGLTEALRPLLPGLARRCFTRVCELVQFKVPTYRGLLRHVKNAAYAWRQMVFFLSRCPASEQEEFLGWAQGHLSAQPHDFANRLAPALARLRAVVTGSDAEALPGRPFLGWSIGPHWVLPERKGAARKG